MLRGNICLISFSDNPDHQNVIYSMFNVMENRKDIFTIGIINPKCSIAPHTERNFYIDAPKRPGITKDTFKISELKKIVKLIKMNNIRFLYFESQHLWNAFIMLLCPQCKKIVAVHDVIPHDGNISMMLSNYVTCHQADHVVVRNKKYQNELSKRYHISQKRITYIALWRAYPEERIPSYGKKVLFFGRLRRYKGLENVEKIIKQTPNISYQLVGAPDRESQSLVNRIKAFHNVEVYDHEVSDTEMELYFRQADWIILPYFTATQSGIIVDAYKFSRPVIAFDVGAISEQVLDGKTGFLVPNGDIKKFIEKINTAVSLSKIQFSEFCHNAYRFGHEKYSAERAVTNFICIFDKMI